MIKKSISNQYTCNFLFRFKNDFLDDFLSFYIDFSIQSFFINLTNTILIIIKIHKINLNLQKKKKESKMLHFNHFLIKKHF